MDSVSFTPSCVLWTDRNVEADAERWRILVVDDNAASAEGLTAALSADGCDARYVLSGVDALQAIDGWVPHIVILDWTMPDTTGGEICRHIRRIKKSAYTYIVIVTANQTAELRVEGLACGADD